jgi:hypothetical protein
MCWVFTIEGLETYILVPRDPADFDLLIESVRTDPGTGDVDVVIGVRGPLASPEVCNGLLVPIVAFDQLYSFDEDELIREIPRPKAMPRRSSEPRPKVCSTESDRWPTTPGLPMNTGH